MQSMDTILAMVLMLQSPAVNVASSATDAPSATEIEIALSGHRAHISSTGYVTMAYAVRNMRCAETVLDAKFFPTANNPVHFMSERGVHQVTCSYDYVAKSLLRNTRKWRGIDQKPATISKRERRRIPEKMWQNVTRDFVRMSDTRCLYMGRIPRPGECRDHWAVVM